MSPLMHRRDAMLRLGRLGLGASTLMALLSSVYRRREAAFDMTTGTITGLPGFASSRV